MWRAVVLTAVVVALAGCGGDKFQKYGADSVVQAYQKAGLSIDNVRPGTRSAQDQSPNVAIEAKDFTIVSIAPRGGQILVFASQKDLDAMKAWFAQFPALAPYVYTRYNVLVQLNSALPKTDAEKYRSALEAMP